MSHSEELELLNLRDEKSTLQKWNYFAGGLLASAVMFGLLVGYMWRESDRVANQLIAQIKLVSDERDTCQLKQARPPVAPWVQ